MGKSFWQGDRRRRAWHINVTLCTAAAVDDRLWTGIIRHLRIGYPELKLFSELGAVFGTEAVFKLNSH